MKERGIIFNSEMVRAILADRKTQTRRIIKPQPPENNTKFEIQDGFWIGDTTETLWEETKLNAGNVKQWVRRKCPYGKVSDRLYVREKYRVASLISYNCDGTKTFDIQFADESYKRVSEIEPSNKPAGRWYPSIHMPKWAARIWLEITKIRVERVQDISEGDAKAEGIYGHHVNTGVGGHMHHDTVYAAFPEKGGGFSAAKEAFECLWDSIHGKGAWDRNDWVWAIEFKRADQKGE